MSVQFTEFIGEKFNIQEEERRILLLSKSHLKRKDRKTYFQYIEPRAKKWVKQLKKEFKYLETSERDKWLNITVESILEKGGVPDISDELAMEVIGRFHVVHEVRQQAEKKGIVLKTLASLGGLSFVLICVILVTSFVLILSSYLK